MFFKKKQLSEEEAKREYNLKVLKRLHKKDRIYYIDYVNGNILCPMKSSDIVQEKDKIIKEIVEKEISEREERIRKFQEQEKRNKVNKDLMEIYRKNPEIQEDNSGLSEQEASDENNLTDEEVFNFDNFFNETEEDVGKNDVETKGDKEEVSSPGEIEEGIKEENTPMDEDNIEKTKDIELPDDDWTDDGDVEGDEGEDINGSEEIEDDSQNKFYESEEEEDEN